jgi:hypothetical protein
MRKYLWLIPVTMLAFASYATAQEKAPAKKGKAAAKLVADPADLKCDLGDVDSGATKDCTIKIKNEGDGEAKNVACKGAGFKFDPAKADVAAAASTDVKATYTAKKVKKDTPIKGTITCGKVKVPVTGTIKAAAAPAK